MSWAFSPSNETEISCGGRESASSAVKVFESSQKLIARLPAVSFIDWLGLSCGFIGSIEPVRPRKLATKESEPTTWIGIEEGSGDWNMCERPVPLVRSETQDKVGESRVANDVKNQSGHSAPSLVVSAVKLPLAKHSAEGVHVASECSLERAAADAGACFYVAGAVHDGIIVQDRANGPITCDALARAY
jgi:hypothetical protein